ncbi:MAG TPA: DUF2911 domain-containing protein [Chryseolinea sp.]|nr:DUF2911 domain-containing protein [Chryseolinea sp.]
MKKKIYVGLGLVLVAIIAYAAYSAFFSRRVSPTQTTEFSHEGVDIKVTYCRPSKKGRVIFGEDNSGALLPYGKYWRLGANESTEISFSENVVFGGKPVSAGTYRMYAVPSAQTWMVVLNSQLGTWGSEPPDPSLDVLAVEVPSSQAPSEAEQFTINFGNIGPATTMDLVWDKTMVSVPITIQ